jgi:hypothetical protein
MWSLKPFLSSNPRRPHVMGRQATPHRREESMGHHAPCPFAILLAFALLCIPSTNALDSLLAADPNVRVVVATTYDEGILAYVSQRIQQGLLTQGLAGEVGVGIRQYNAQITAIASHDSRVAVADLYGLFDGIIAADHFSVGGLTLDRKTADATPDHLFC